MKRKNSTAAFVPVILCWTLALLCQAIHNPAHGQLPEMSEAEQAKFVKGYELMQGAEVTLSEGNANEAVQMYGEAFDLWRDVLGDNEVAANQQCVLAKKLVQLGRFDDAHAFYHRAEQACINLFGENHLSVATIRNNIAQCFDSEGRVDKAEAIYLKSIENIAAASGVGSQSHATFMYLTSGFYQHHRMFDKAAMQLEKVAVMCDASPQWSAEFRAGVRKTYAQVLVEQNKVNQARLELDKALALCDAGGPECRLLRAVALYDLGNLHQSQGQYADAETRYRESLSIWKIIRNEPSYHLAATHNSLGLALIAQRKFEEGIKHLFDSVEVIASADDATIEHVAEIARNMSSGAFLCSAHDIAHKYAIESLLLLYATAGPIDSRTGRALYNAGLTAMFIGDNDTASEQFANSLKVLGMTLGDANQDLADAHFGAGIFYTAMGDSKNARATYNQGMQILRRRLQMVLPTLASSEQDDYISLNRRNTASLWSFAYGQLREQEIVDQSAQWLVNYKGLGMEAMATQVKLRQLEASNNPLARQLLDLQSRIAANAMRLRPTDKSERDQMDEQQLQLNVQYNASVRRLNAQSSAEGGIHSSEDRWYTLEEVRNAIPSNALYVDFHTITPSRFDAKAKRIMVDPPHYVAWVIPGDKGNSVRLIDLGPVERIDAEVTACRTQIALDADRFRERRQLARQGLPYTRPVTEANEFATTSKLNVKLRKLATQILDPVLSDFGDYDELIFAPDQNLWLVPWAALPINDDREELLIERASIRIVNHARQLVQQSSGRSVDSSPSIVVADPNYDLATEEPTSPAVDGRSSLEMNVANGSRFSFDSLFNGEEAEKIGKLIEQYTSSVPKLLLHDQATETAIKQVSNPRILVFITHGMFLKDPIYDTTNSLQMMGQRSLGDTMPISDIPTNPFLRGVLMLAGCNHATQGAVIDDGVLTALEVSGLQLAGTELVFLGACNTGNGETKVGEGIAGLTQAFQIAGARHVMSTLWDADNISTRTLTESFFKHLLLGEKHHVALRSAQLEILRQGRSDVGAAHPYYWSGMTITGM